MVWAWATEVIHGEPQAPVPDTQDLFIGVRLLRGSFLLKKDLAKKNK